MKELLAKYGQKMIDATIERFNLSDSQATIVVLLPVNILLAIILIIVTMISFILIGLKVL